MKMVLISLVFLAANMSFLGSEFSEKLPELQKEFRKIAQENQGKEKGKFSELIKTLEGLEYNKKSEDEVMMFNSAVAEICSANGDYDKSNKHLSNIIAKFPHSTFFKKKVLNMLKKGDKKAANKVVEEFKKTSKDKIKNEEDRARQLKHLMKTFEEFDLIQKDLAKKKSAKKESE